MKKRKLQASTGEFAITTDQSIWPNITQPNQVLRIGETPLPENVVRLDASGNVGIGGEKTVAILLDITL